MPGLHLPPSPPLLEFDWPHYQAIDHARAEWLDVILNQLPCRRELKTALDVGCGAGYFSRWLHQRGFSVLGIDLRAENLDVCRARHPQLAFAQVNLDEPFRLEPCDLVLMFGILYHLQSPLLTLQHLAPVIGRVGIVSSRVAPGAGPALYLYREHRGVAHNWAPVTAVPTFAALVTLFELGGLDHVYRPDFQPRHPEWDRGAPGQRHSLIVAREPLHVPGWRRMHGSAPWLKWQTLPWHQTFRRWLRGWWSGN